MRRRDFALKMGLAHGAGLVGLVIVGAIMRGDPNPGGNITLFFIGMFMSAFLFVPILAVTLTNLRAVLRHRVAFVVLGPVAMALLTLAMFGLAESKVIAIQTSLSSLVLYLLIRNDKTPDSAAA